MNPILELYSRLGESLKSMGIEESVLPMSAANSALDIYEANNNLVLGGDIYIKKSSGSFELLYANWFYEGDNIEDSINKARGYLKQFNGKDLYVSFVLK